MVGALFLHKKVFKKNKNVKKLFLLNLHLYKNYTIVAQSLKNNLFLLIYYFYPSLFFSYYHTFRFEARIICRKAEKKVIVIC